MHVRSCCFAFFVAVAVVVVKASYYYASKPILKKKNRLFWSLIWGEDSNSPKTRKMPYCFEESSYRITKIVRAL